MISNQERRRVAKRLRGLEAWDCDGEFYDRGEVEDELGLSTDDGAWYDAGGVSRLADLIDRPTCNAYEDWDYIEVDIPEVRVWACEDCDERFPVFRLSRPLYCPVCGAELISR